MRYIFGWPPGREATHPPCSAERLKLHNYIQETEVDVTYDFDLFVIGAGSGGVRAARISAGLGARVAIAEAGALGGTCINVGCVPKKLFVYASQYAQSFQESHGFGWRREQSQFDWPTLRDNKSQEISRLNSVYETLLQNSGAEIKQGFAHLLDPHTVQIGAESYTARRILIAVGGRPRKPEFPGAEFCMSSDDVFRMETLPKSVLIQGGGYIAVEFAGIFNGLGCKTELVYRDTLFLRGFDDDLRGVLASEMREKGVQLNFDTDIERITRAESGILEVHLSDGQKRSVDAVLSAIGRVPNVGSLGLEQAGVELDARGYIQVDDQFQTTQASIYAVGDVIGRVQLTPVAIAEGMALAEHWFADKPLNVDYHNIATAVFSQPSFASVGLTERDAMAENKKVDIYISNFRSMRHTLSGLTERTLMKLIVETETGRVLGAHMLGAEAAEIIQGIAIAIKAGATKKDFDSTVGIHPTLAEEFVTMRTVRSSA